MADGKVVIDTELLSKGAVDGMKKLGGTLAKVGGAGVKAIGTSVAATTVAVGALAAASVKAYAENEQLIGGVDTLFGESSKKLQNYANEAYKTAGMSANSYMAAVTSFSASLLQGLGGDTAKAADYANQALIDMSDNANKFGTDMEAIQVAYQGFSKQNFTMLDNLKLGYGGTKTEMERLLEDAQKLSGVKYDVTNFADVTKAINVIQTELGITGTTAKEASTTITGSLTSVKAAFDNLLVGLAGGVDLSPLIDNLVTSIGTAFNNLLPVVSQSLLGIDKLIRKLFPVIVEQLPVLFEEILPQFLELGGFIFESISKGLLDNMDSIVFFTNQLVSMILNGLPMFLDVGLQILTAFIQGMLDNVDGLTATITDVLTQIVSLITENAPIMIDAALSIIKGLAEGLIENLPVMIPMIIEFIRGLVEVIGEQLPIFVELAVQIIGILSEALLENIDLLATIIWTLLRSSIQIALGLLPQLTQLIINLVAAYMVGMVKYVNESIVQLIETIKTSVDSFNKMIEDFKKTSIDKIKELPEKIKALNKDFVLAGINIAKGIIDGFAQKIGEIIGKVIDMKNQVAAQLADFNPLGAIGDAVKNGVSNITANMQVKSDATPAQNGRPSNTMSNPSTNVYINTSASKLFNAVVEQNNGYSKGGYTPLASY